MLIINKTDLVAADELAALRGWLARNAPDVPTYDTVHGRMPLDVLLGHVKHRGVEPDDGVRSPGHGHHSWLLDRDKPVSRAAMSRLADRLGKRVFRAKGFVALADEPGRVFLFQQVGRRWTLKPAEAPAGTQKGMRIVVIEPHRSGGILTFDSPWKASPERATL
jgi:G3E family GTPase